MIRKTVKYPWGDRILNYRSITIIEKNETTGDIYYSVEISDKTASEKGYASADEMALTYLKYQCMNEFSARECEKNFRVYTPYVLSYDITMNRKDNDGILKPNVEHVIRYVLWNLDYDEPLIKE